MPAKLTPKQKNFIDEYLLDLNATQAAIRAGYSRKTANRIGPQLLVKTCIQEELAKAMQRRAKRTEITADRVLKELAAIALDDAADYQDSRLKYTNKIRALELLGKHLGMFDQQRRYDDSESGSGGGIVILPEIMDGDPDV